MNSVRQPVRDLGSLIDRTTGNAAFAVVSLQNTDLLSGQFGLGFASAAQQAFSDGIHALLRDSDQLSWL